jgi:FTR1 family protein
MFESLVITLREGIEAALAVGIILIYLRKSGRGESARYVFFGLAAAVAASLAGAAGLGRLNLNEETTEGVLMVLAGILLVTMVIWMARHARTLRKGIEARLDGFASSGGRLGGAVGLFAFTFFLVFREGMETVLLLSAVRFNSDALLAFVGGGIGLALAVLFGVAFVKGSVRVDLGRFFRVTSVVLSILAVQLFIGGAHELAEGGVLPLGRTQMRIIGPIVKADALFMAALLALPLIILLIPGRREPGPTLAKSRPEMRLALARARNERFWRTLASTAGLLIVVSLTSSYAYSRLPREFDPPRMIDPVGGEVRLPVAAFGEGTLQRFGVRVPKGVVRFFVVEYEPGAPVVSFDACEICGPSGYVQEGHRLICLNCAADIVPSTVGRGGGCNPIPLPSRIEGGDLVITMEDLMTEASRFVEVEEG